MTLGSPFRTPPSRCASGHPYPPAIQQRRVQPHPRKPQACLSISSPICNTSSLSSTITRFNDNCKSTLDRIRADIDALHAYYQDIIQKERAETAKARTIARTMEAERNTARESVIKITGDQKKLMKEHLTLKVQLAGVKLPSVEETEGESQGTGKKRKRTCLTAEALSCLEKQEAEEEDTKRGTPDNLGDSCKLHACDDAAERVDEKPPLKRFRLQKRVWRQNRSGEGSLVEDISVPMSTGGVGRLEL